MSDSLPSIAATFILPAGTKLEADDIGATLHADAVVVCDQRDAWMLRAVLGLPIEAQRCLRSQADPDSLKPDQAAGADAVMTSSSSVGSMCSLSASRTCSAVKAVLTIQVESR